MGIGLFNDGDFDLKSKWNALSESQAIIEFTPDGIIIDANTNFLGLMEYDLGDILGKHHRIFVDKDYAASLDYQEFWAKLNRGEPQIAQFKRITRTGKEVWIEASYNPIRNRAGRLVKVVKFAVDVTAQKLSHADLAGQVAAIGKSQAVIEFDLTGTILDANQNFLTVLGYERDEIVGKHHRMFVDPTYASSREYADFWKTLASGEFQQAQYKRCGKGGREIWIEASYNPIFDMNGKPFKVVKFATDITEQVRMLAQLKTLIDVNFGEIDGALFQSNEKAAGAAGAASEASSNVQMVASAAEELSASITEISASMSKSQAATDEAFLQTEHADEAARRLNETASDMNSIVKLIHNIAAQINLLSLNATIESARAGEAGRGFAVVAGEVKNLATQAANATQQITQRISGIQAVAQDVTASLGNIRRSIANVQEYVSATASAVEEQAAVTQSMSSNMQGAATSVETISGNVSEISCAVAQVGQAVAKTKDAASVLAR